MGRPEFENQTMISAVSSRNIAWLTQQNSTPLAPNTYDRITIYSPQGTMSKIINFQQSFGAIPGQTTGNREMYLDNALDVTTGIGIYKCMATDYTLQLLYDQSMFKYSNGSYANITTLPISIDSINQAIREVKFDDTIGISFVFRHSHSADSGTAIRKVILFVEREVVKR